MSEAGSLEAVIAAVGRENALTGDAAAEFAIAGGTPRVALFPDSLDAFCEALAAAYARDLAVAPYGGGTQIGIGAPPTRLDAVVVTRRLNRVVDYQPDDMTVTVEAGLTMAALQAALGERGQFLPLDPPLAARATVGGTVAANATGPWRCAYGSARDWLIGVRVVAPDGRIVKGGGRVVKNVAGYDLCKLYTGSLGTLGVLAELTFKVLPRPETAGIAAVPLRFDQVEPLLAAIMDSDVAPSALELFAAGADPSETAPEGGAALLARFDGPREAIEWQFSEVEGMAVRHAAAQASRITDLSLWDHVRDWAGGDWAWLAVAGTTSSEVAAMAQAGLEAGGAAGAPLEIVARAATGAIYCGARHPLTPEAARTLTERLRAEATNRGGTLVVLQAAPELRDGLDPWGPLGAEWRLMQGIKAQLDPKGLMNPGRFVGRI